MLFYLSYLLYRPGLSCTTSGSSSTLAGGIKANPTAGSGTYRRRAFIPKGCAGNGVTSAGLCTVADRRRQLAKTPSSSKRPISSLRFSPSCPACSSAALHNVVIRPSDSEVRSALITSRYVKAGQKRLSYRPIATNANDLRGPVPIPSWAHP